MQNAKLNMQSFREAITHTLVTRFLWIVPFTLFILHCRWRVLAILLPLLLPDSHRLIRFNLGNAIHFVDR